MHEGTRYGPQTHSQFDVREPHAYTPTMDCKIKAPTAVGRMWLVGLGFCVVCLARAAGASQQSFSEFNCPSAVAGRIAPTHDPSQRRDPDPPGRIRRGDRGVMRSKSFVGEVMRAANRAAGQITASSATWLSKDS